MRELSLNTRNKGASVEKKESQENNYYTRDRSCSLSLSPFLLLLLHFLFFFFFFITVSFYNPYRFCQACSTPLTRRLGAKTLQTIHGLHSSARCKSFERVGTCKLPSDRIVYGIDSTCVRMRLATFSPFPCLIP